MCLEAQGRANSAFLQQQDSDSTSQQLSYPSIEPASVLGFVLQRSDKSAFFVSIKAVEDCMIRKELSPEEL